MPKRQVIVLLISQELLRPGTWSCPLGLLAHASAEHQARRLVADEPLRMETYAIEMDIVERLRRVYSYARRLARTVEPHREAETEPD